MKKLMIIVSLMLATELSYAPEEVNIRTTDTTEELTAKAKTQQEAVNAEHAITDQHASSNTPNTLPTSVAKTPEGTAPGSVYLDVPIEIDEVQHPDQKGWFTTKKSSTIITNHGDGTHSITNKEEAKGWFTNKKTSITEKYDTFDIEEDLKSLKQNGIDSSNIDAIKSKIRDGNKFTVKNSKNGKIETSTDEQGNTIKYSYRPDGSIDSKAIEYSDRSSLKIVYTLDNTIIEITTNADKSSKEITYNQQGEIISTIELKAPVLESLTTPQIIFNENNEAIVPKYNDNGKVIEKNNIKTKEVEKITYQSDGTSTGITKDAKGNVIKTTFYDKDGQITTPKLFA